jgi:hypothetical protein
MKYLVMIDAPGEHPPLFQSELRRCIQKALDGYGSFMLFHPKVQTVGKVQHRPVRRKQKAAV